ncbi:MAG: rhodanese-like domain-containing protein [Beijerinckiaceae bacterium]
MLQGFFASLSTADGSPLREIDAATAREWKNNGDCLLIDVREDREYRAERISGSHLAPLSRLERELASVRTAARAVFFCQNGIRTRIQAGRLARCGFGEAYNLKGGISAWKAHGFPVERG